MSRMQIIGDSVVVFGDNITQAAVTVYKAPPGMVGDALAS